MAKTILPIRSLKLRSLCIVFFLVAGAKAYAEDAFEDQLKTYDRDEIHSIHKKLYTKKGRHELGVGMGGIVNHNGFFLLTGQYTYHLFENLGIEAAAGGLGFQSRDNNKLYFYQGSLAFSPLYGKISLFTWSVVNFDVYFIGGAGVVSYKGLNPGSSFMGNVGGGIRCFINEYLSTKVEFRDYMYKKQLGTSSEIWENYALTAGVSVLIPFRQKY